jgi:hypothetical protein
MLVVMSHRTRIRIAAASTAVFLAGLSTAGIAVRSDHRPAATPQAAAVSPQASAPRSDNTAGQPLGDEEHEFDD